MRWLVMLISFSFLLAPISDLHDAYAYVLKGSDALTAPIVQSIETLPPCIMEGVNKGGFKSVQVVKHGKLGSLDVGGVTYYRQADSFFKSGNVYIDSSFVTSSTVVLHEMGHWWAQSGLSPYRHAWDRATSLDYADMSSHERKENGYLKDPDEAFAELFAYHFVGDRYISKHYKPLLFPRSNAMLSEILAKACQNPIQ